jgi:starch synthase
VRVPAVLTIHNIAYQGLFPKECMARLAIPERDFDINGVEFHDSVSFLKAGLISADHVTTVSPTYAREITTEAHGGGLHGLTRGIAAEGRLSGIVNGIDESWDPASDPHLPHHFEAENLSGKQQNADLVRTGLCLTPSEGPLFGVVSRLVHQKGLDIVADTARDIGRADRHPRPRRSGHGAYAESARAQRSRPYRPAHRLQRTDGAPDRRGERLLPDALAI